MSDSNYAAATRHKRPLSTAGRPPALDVVDDAWAADTLSDDEIEVSPQREADLAQLLETEGELDDVAVVVAAGQSGSATNGAAERRRREEGRWNDLGLDNLDTVAVTGARSRAAGQGGGQ